MKIKHKISIIARQGIGFTALAFMLTGCPSGSSSSDAATTTTTTTTNGTVITGVATPSKVSVVNTK